MKSRLLVKSPLTYKIHTENPVVTLFPSPPSLPPVIHELQSRYIVIYPLRRRSVDRDDCLRQSVIGHCTSLTAAQLSCLLAERMVGQSVCRGGENGVRGGWGELVRSIATGFLFYIYIYIYINKYIYIYIYIYYCHATEGI